jgi:hypothetical protein
MGWPPMTSSFVNQRLGSLTKGLVRVRNARVKSGPVLVLESPAPTLVPHPPNLDRGWGRHFRGERDYAENTLDRRNLYRRCDAHDLSGFTQVVGNTMVGNIKHPVY